MTWFRRLALARLCSDEFVVLLGQLACLAAAPALFFFAVVALQRHAATPGELVIGLLATCVASLLFIVSGLVLPLGLLCFRFGSG